MNNKTCGVCMRFLGVVQIGDKLIRRKRNGMVIILILHEAQTNVTHYAGLAGFSLDFVLNK